MKEVLIKFEILFGVFFGIVLFLIISPFLLIWLPYLKYNNRKIEKAYNDFLDANEGKKFFCYTSKRKSKKIVEELILPELKDDVNIILLDGKKPISDFPVQFISRMLYRIDNVGFPNIMEIINGNVTDISLKKEFYNELSRGKVKENFNGVVKLGFEILKKKGLN